MIPLSKPLVSETLGTALLLAVVVGSGIMGDHLAQGNTAIALLANALATGCGLFVLILIFVPISGAHFNPLVSMANYINGEISARQTLGYVMAQLCGAFVGVAIAHMMFVEPVFTASTHAREGISQLFSAFVATFGLFAVILSCRKYHPSQTPVAIACYIVAAYWLTASTSFANPAVTLARAATNTFAGIAPADVLGFIIVQTIGALTALLLFGWLLNNQSSDIS